MCPSALRAQETSYLFFVMVQRDMEVESCLSILHFSIEKKWFSVVCDVDGEDEDGTEYCEGLPRTLLFRKRMPTRSHQQHHCLPYCLEKTGTWSLAFLFSACLMSEGKRVFEKTQGSSAHHTKSRTRTLPRPYWWGRQPWSPTEEQTPGSLRSGVIAKWSVEWCTDGASHAEAPLRQGTLKKSLSKGSKVSEIQSTRLHVVYHTE